MKLKKLKNLFAYFGYLIILLYLFFPALTAGPDKYLFGWDTMDAQYFTRIRFSMDLHKGIFPWWDPYLFSGRPFAAGTEGPIFFYPPTWLFFFLPFSTALTWFYIIHIFMAMTGMYILVKLWAGKLESFFAGLVFGLTGYFIPRVLAGTAGNLASAAYLPLVFYCFFRAWQSRNFRSRFRLLTAGAVLLALQLIAGDPRMAVFSLMVLGLAAVLHSFWDRSIKPFMLLFSGLLLSLLFSALQFLPQAQFILLSHRRGKLPYEMAWKNSSLSFDHLKELIYPLTAGFKPDIYNYPPFPEGPFYTGIIPLLLVSVLIIFIAVKRKLKNWKIVLIFILTAVFALWFAASAYAPFDIFGLLWKNIPLFNFVRVPLRFSLVFIFSIAVLSSFSLKLFKNRKIVILLITLFLAEAVYFDRQFLIVTDLPENRHDRELVNDLTSDKGRLFRLHQNYFYTQRLGYSFDMNAPDLYGIYSTGGYLPLIIGNYYDFYTDAFIHYDRMSVIGLNQMPPVLDGYNHSGFDFLNIKYVYGAGDMNLNEVSDKFVPVILNSYIWFNLFENKQANPRFFLAPYWVKLNHRKEVEEAIRTDKYDLRDTVILTSGEREQSEGLKNESACLGGKPGEVSVNKYGNNYIEVETKAPCDSYLVSSEVMYPGWEAYIDGKKTDILTGNLAFRTVPVPAGKHTVVYKFVPWIFLYGGLITAGTAISLLIIYKKFK